MKNGNKLLYHVQRALYIGRFQPFHYGHLHSVKWILEREEELIIGIGSAQFSHTWRNPFTAGERILMITRVLRAENLMDRVYISAIPDTDTQHNMWVSMVKTYSPPFDRVYTNDPLSRLLFEEAGIEVYSIPYYNREKYEATLIRKMIATGNDEWKKLVHPEVVRVIMEIGGEERLREIFKTTK